jgi:fluoroquinolone resistance protein
LQLKKEIEHQTFKKENFSQLDLKAKIFSHVVFEGCDFTRSDFTCARFLECRFVGCNLSLPKLDGVRLQDVEFENCKLVGADFTQCDKMFLGLRFKKCLLDTSNFSDLDLKNTLFQECVIRDTCFTNAHLVGVDFKGSDLKGSTFHNTNLSKADFRAAVNYSVNPVTNKLLGARFSEPEVMALLQYLGIVIE